MTSLVESQREASLSEHIWLWNDLKPLPVLANQGWNPSLDTKLQPTPCVLAPAPTPAAPMCPLDKPGVENKWIPSAGSSVNLLHCSPTVLCQTWCPQSKQLPISHRGNGSGRFQCLLPLPSPLVSSWDSHTLGETPDRLHHELEHQQNFLCVHHVFSVA